MTAHMFGRSIVTRRKFLLAAGPTLVSQFTALSDGLLSWLMRACRFDVGDLRFVGAG